MKAKKVKPAHHYILIGALLLPGCIQQSRDVVSKRISLSPRGPLSQPEPTTSATAPPITIWIHGTRFFPRSMFKNFFHCSDGLTKATDLGKHYRLRQVMNALVAGNPQQYPLETCYLFGWSGRLSFVEREEYAQLLYNQLCSAIAQYKKQYHCQSYYLGNKDRRF